MQRRYHLLIFYILLFFMQATCQASLKKLWAEKLYGDFRSPMINSKDQLFFYLDATDPDDYNQKNPKKFYAYHAIDGGRLWNVNTEVLADGVIGSDGTIYLMDSEDYLMALDPSSGEVLWKTIVPGSLNNLSLSPDKKTIYTIGSGGTLTAVDISGKIKWQFTIKGNNADVSVYKHLTVADDGIIYVCDNDGVLHAIAPAGKELWRKAFQGKLNEPIVDVARNRIYIAARIDPGYYVYLRDSLYCLDIKTQTIIWQKKYPQISALSLSPDGGIYFIYADKQGSWDWIAESILALDENGEKRWDYKISPWGVRQEKIDVRPNGDLYIAVAKSLLILSKNGVFIANYPIDAWNNYRLNQSRFFVSENDKLLYVFAQDEDGVTRERDRHLRIAVYGIN